MFSLVNHKRVKETYILLRQHFFKSQVVYTPGNLDKFLIGLATQPMQKFDNWFTEEVTQLSSCFIQERTDDFLTYFHRSQITCLKKRDKDSEWI